MAEQISFHEALALLRKADVFSAVALETFDEERHQLVARAELAQSLEPTFFARMKTVLDQRNQTVSDATWASVMESILEESFAQTLDFFVELPGFFETDPEVVRMPPRVHLHLDLSAGRTNIAKRRLIKTGEEEIATEDEKKMLLRHVRERERSRRRRAEKKLAMIDAGTYSKPGKTSYVQRVQSGDAEYPSWEPTPEGQPVMEAADDVWGKTVDTYPGLVAHLNAPKLGLASLDKKPFTKSMMPRLIAQLELLRGSWEPWRHSRTTG